MDRYVNVISGLPRTGKTHLLDSIMERPEYRNAPVIRMDEVGRRFWGDRQSMRAGSTTTELTRTEKIYRNELTRCEIKNRLVVYNTEIVMAEMPLLTRGNHQRPLVEMVESAGQYIKEIQQDQYLRDTNPVSADFPSVHLNVVLLYASLDRVRIRIENSSKSAVANSDAGHINVYLDAALQFEFPECYMPLLVDTTKESQRAEQQRIEEVLAFFRGDIPQGDLAAINSRRIRDANSYLEEAKDQARIANIR